MVVQHVLTAAEARALGGDVPEGTPDDVVYIIGKDDETGQVVWISWDSGDVDPEDRFNTDLPVEWPGRKRDRK